MQEEEMTEELLEQLSLDDKTSQLVEKMTEWEKLGQGVITGKRVLVELDQRRQKCREALRQLRTEAKDTRNKKSKNWVCFGSTTFINVNTDQAVKMIEDDMKVIDETTEAAREELKKRVDELRKMEDSKDLEQLGFKLNPVV